MGKGQIDEEEYGLRLRLLFLTCEMLKDMEPPGDEASSGSIKVPQVARVSRAEGSGMIVPSSGVKVMIAMKPVDFRKGMDGLAAVVHETLGANPFGGVIYVFRSKRTDRVKLLFWDGTGLVLATKRLEQGSFRWPSLREGVMRLTPGQLVALLEGLDWARVRGVRISTPTAVS
jgi:transposase